MTQRKLWGLALGAVLSWLPALFGSTAVAQATGLHHLASGPSPYFQPSHAGLLYIITPLVVVSSFIFYLSPGGILILALGQARKAGEWIIFGFGASLLLSVVLGTVGKLVVGPRLDWPFLLTIWLTAAVFGWLLLAYRLRRGDKIPWPIAHESDSRRLILAVGVCILGIALLTPKLFWENFNLDGIEAFEFGRSLTSHILPHWELQDGIFGFYPNFVLFAYPNHWFISLFGPVEAAARLPFILYLVVLFSGLTLVIEHKEKRTLSFAHELVLWLGLVLFSIVQVFNSNYEPFFADIAEMAATDTLWISCFILACYALWSDRPFWFWLFAIMTYSASPGGLLLLATLGVATFLAKPDKWQKQTRQLMAILAICVGIGLGYTLWYKPVFIGEVNDQFSALNMLRRLYPPTLTEFVRLNAFLFPSGLLPALSFLAVRRKEPYSLVIALISLGYFGTVYIQAWTSLHQFTPVMVLPLIVFWRLLLRNPRTAPRWLVPSLVGTTILSMFLSLPRHFQINQATREFGRATAFHVGDYNNDYESSVDASWSLYALLPEDYRLQYPNQPWGTDALSWLYYATREKPADQKINYVIQGSSDPVPPGATEITSQDGVTVYVQDVENWQRDREQDSEQVAVSPLYEPILRRTYQFFREYTESTAGG